MNDTVPPPGPAKSGPNRTVLIVVGVIVLCCGCIAALLVGQYLLENSDFTLVGLLRAIA